MSKLFRVGLPLSMFVDFIWITNGGGAVRDSGKERSRERVLPNGAFDLIVTLNPSGRNWAGVAGVRTRPLIIKATGATHSLAVHFKPGASRALFGLPAGELQNLIIDLDLLLGSGAGALQQQLLEQLTDAQRVKVMERFLLGRLSSHVLHPGVRHTLLRLRSGGDLPGMRAIQEQAGLSQQRFLEHFQHDVGMKPKLYQRLCRFRRTLVRMDTGSAADWADIALAGGYFDQAHFNHDFLEFAGITPTAYLANRLANSHVRVVE